MHDGDPFRESAGLVGIGEAMVLLEPPTRIGLADAESLSVQVAGAEFNACAAYAALGGRATFATRLGAGPLAEHVRRAGRRCGIEIAAEEDPARPTGVFFKDPDPTGERRVHYYRAGSAAAALDAEDWDWIRALDPGILLVSGLTAALGPDPERLVRRAATTTARAGGVVAIDANLRPALGRLAEAAETVRDLLPAADVLVVGTDEAEPILGTDDPVRILRAARDAGCGEVVVKAGADGCHVLDEDGTPRHLPALARTVVDPVGAGDAFTGSYLRARGLGLGPVAAARAASEVAAAIVESRGDVAGLTSARVAAVRDRLGAVRAG